MTVSTLTLILFVAALPVLVLLGLMLLCAAITMPILLIEYVGIWYGRVTSPKSHRPTK